VGDFNLTALGFPSGEAAKLMHIHRSHEVMKQTHSQLSEISLGFSLLVSATSHTMQIGQHSTAIAPPTVPHREKYKIYAAAETNSPSALTF